MVIEGGLHAWFWVWVESLRWLRQGVVVLMLFCSDQMMGDGFGRGFDKSDNDGRVVMWWWCREVMWRPVSQWWWDWERDGSTIKVRGGDGGWWWLWCFEGVNSKNCHSKLSSRKFLLDVSDDVSCSSRGLRRQNWIELFCAEVFLKLWVIILGKSQVFLT